ncbi:MAG TPA: NfeD family protein [Herpetosiphonaceae bacterium]
MNCFSKSCFAVWLMVYLFLVALLPSGIGAQSQGQVYYVAAEQGLTTPAISLVRRALREAEAANAKALVIEVRGGGSLDGTWQLARDLAAARVPVVAYIAPRGGRSGPVGTLLVTAAHVAAMAPGATIGFAEPLVDIPSNFSPTTQRLVVEDAVKQLTAWAQARQHNADWIEQAVRSGAIVTAEQAHALDPPVIDVVATEDELLASLQGRRVTLAHGETRTLETLGAQVQRVEPMVWESLGQLLALPSIAFVLFVLGGIALYLELANPGVGIPGIAGAILVVAALVGFVLGEVRPLAVLLLAAGLVVVGLEHVVMSHGGLTVAGLILLVLGALYLVDPARTPGLGVSSLVIAGVALVLAGAASGLVALAVRVRARRPVTGRDALIGQVAEVRQTVAPEGQVFVNGALWSAWTDDGPFAVGDFVEVVGVEGLRLYVRRVGQEAE